MMTMKRNIKNLKKKVINLLKYIDKIEIFN
jgi:hypothetical protein